MSKRSGALFETRALLYLQQNGMTLIARNVHCRYGEIDLVMHDANRTLVFVEVRARANMRFGGALASISATKQARLRMAAQVYLMKWGKPLPICRFDVVAFEGKRVIWLVNVFNPSS